MFKHVNMRLFCLTILPIVLSGCGGETDLLEEGDSVDVTAPSLTLKGESILVLTQGQPFEDPGVTAEDDVDGVLSNVHVSGAVDTSKVGVYQLTYSVQDSAGNQASVSRSVRVEKSIAPNDTGVYWGGNAPSGNNVTCTGESVGQQDCAEGRDAKAEAGTLPKTGTGRYGFDFTKLDANGDALDVSATDWRCVRDNHTGLVWEVKTDSGLHSKTDAYNWYSEAASVNGGAKGFAGTYESGICEGYVEGQSETLCNTQAYVARVNAAGLCGANDWRLPEREELRSIVDYGFATPPLMDADYFPNTQKGLGVFYWTNTPSALNGDEIPGSAWTFYSDDYGMSAIQITRSENGLIRLVRTEQGG